MKRLFSTVLLVAGALALIGCQRQADSAANKPAATNDAPQIYLSHAQPKLPTLKLWLGSEEITAEVARRTVEVATGMMYRTNVAETEGMLFVFPRPYQATFYMRNTTLTLTAAYIAPDGTILELHDLKPLDETPVAAASDNVQFVLEMAQGWFQRHNVATGSVIRTPYGALLDVNWNTLGPRRTQ